MRCLVLEVAASYRERSAARGTRCLREESEQAPRIITHGALYCPSSPTRHAGVARHRVRRTMTRRANVPCEGGTRRSTKSSTVILKPRARLEWLSARARRRAGRVQSWLISRPGVLFSRDVLRPRLIVRQWLRSSQGLRQVQ